VKIIDPHLLVQQNKEIRTSEDFMKPPTEKKGIIKHIWLFFWRRLDCAFLALLTYCFKCDSWHASAPYSNRPYKKTVVNLVNSLAPRCVVELGCGFGDIIYRVKAEHRYGYDIDEGAIRIARLLHGRRVNFICGEASSIEQKAIDVLILVNWIHVLSPTELESLLLPLLPKTQFLVLDAKDPGGSSICPYKHDFAFLRNRAERTSITPAPDEQRKFHLFKVTI